MKKCIIPAALILMICSAGYVHALQRISVTLPVFQFGTIPRGQIVEHLFIVKNEGDMPLAIKGVRPSCGCTVAKASSSIIQPGKTSEIKVAFNSANFTGAIYKTIAVETDDPREPVLTLTLTGSVLEDISVKPRQINLGVLKTGSVKEITVTIENNGKKPVRIISISSPTPRIYVHLNKDLLKPGESATFTVTVSPRGDDRVLSGYISIITDNPAKGEINVPVFASITN